MSLHRNTIEYPDRRANDHAGTRTSTPSWNHLPHPATGPHVDHRDALACPGSGLMRACTCCGLSLLW